MKHTAPPRIEAIVLSRKAYAEADWIVTLFTREQGLLRAIAPHARASKRRFGGSLDLFCLVQAALSPRMAKGGKSDGSLERLASAELVEPHLGLRSALEALETAALACEAVASLTHEHECLPELFDDLAGLLAGAGAAPPERQGLLRLWFLLRLLADVGMAPQVSACVRCRRGLGEFEEALFSSTEGGILCQYCAGPLGVRALPLAGLRVLERVSRLPLGELSQVKVSQEGSTRLAGLLTGFVEERAGKPLRSAGTEGRAMKPARRD